MTLELKKTSFGVFKSDKVPGNSKIKQNLEIKYKRK